MKQMVSPTTGLTVSLVLILGLGTGFAHPFAPLPVPDENVEGTWLGSLQAGGVALRLVFHISRDSADVLTATIDSPDQGTIGIQVGAVTVTGDTLRMEVPAIGGGYEGTISADGTTIDGTWSQSGQTFPLVLERTDEVPVVQRPQEPKEPYPYDADEVTFENAAAGITLAGTLTTPRSEGPFPAVVLISGSGPQDRDEALLGHRPFLVLADYLTRQGIAVLRFDDRGVGQSTGSFATATTEDFASDALAGVVYLKGRSEIDPAKIGLAGHSEGGLVAPMVAVQTPDVAFIVLMAGPGLTGEEILYLQAALIFEANGASEEAITRNRRQQERLFEVLEQEPHSADAAPKLLAIMKETVDAMTGEEKQAAGIPEGNVETMLDGQVQQLNTPWFRFFLSYDPVPTLQKVRCPVLAVNGEKDLQVPPQENLSAIESALRQGGNQDVTVVALEGLNHLFQTAETGAPSEYSTIEETFSPNALAVIGNWILKQTSQ